MADSRPHVVIIGGGFGGVRAAKSLRKEAVRVTLLDRRNHHLFQPLLYQVATAGLSAPDIAYPIRQMFRGQDNCTVYLADVLKVERAAKQVHIRGGEPLSYDALIVATGVTHNYFGNDEWAPHAPGLKSLDEALEIRRRVLTAFENAEREPDLMKRRAWLTFAVIGGGPTGVEMAGALSEIAKKTLAKDFRSFEPDETSVVLIDASDRVLGGFSEESSAAACEQLQSLDVSVELGQRVTTVDDSGVEFGDKRLETKTVVWAAGVQATDLIKTLACDIDGLGRAKITDRLHLRHDANVYVVGDAAYLEQDGQALPGVAQVAMQQGEHAAKNIIRAQAGEDQTPFDYLDKGSLATIGRSKAVAEIGERKFSGFFAWLVWVVVHILFLAGFRNRFVVFFEWVWAYLTYSRSARVILEQPFQVISDRDTVGDLSAANGREAERPPEDSQTAVEAEPAPEVDE